MKADIKIRLMKKEDFYNVALLMSYAFRDKLPFLKKYDEYEVRDFMLAGGVFSEYSLEGHYVAETNNRIVGVLHLDSKELNKKRIKAPLKSGYIVRKFGLIRSLLCGISFLFLHYNIPEGEMFIDYIAVHPEFRGCGIGSKLLDYGEKIVLKADWVFIYSLRVIGKNTSAKRLYERKGFAVKEVKRQFIAYLFTGVRLYYKMVKDLSSGVKNRSMCRKDI